MSKATPLTTGTTLPQDGQRLVPVRYLEDRHVCVSCKGILQRPYQLHCGHHACCNCLDGIFAKGEPAKCPKSTEDDPCDDLFKKDTFLDVNVMKEIANQKVYCRNNEQGCPVVDTRKNILKHEENCDYQIVQCLYSGCKEPISKINFEKHISECQFVPILCRKCREEIPKLKLDEHEENDCPEIIVVCPYRCSTTGMKRRHLQEHLNTCSLKPKKCSFDFVGCEFCGTDIEIEAHSQEAVVQHTYLVAQTSRRENQGGLSAFKEMMVTTGKKIKSLTMELAQLTTKIDTLTEKAVTIEKQVMEQPRRENIEEHSRNITTLTERLQTLCTQMSEISNTGGILTQFGTLNEMSERVSDRLDVQERRIDMQGAKLAEMELKHQILESASYDGSIVWKIGEYRRRKQDAVDGRTISLYSQPFFTGRFGYKMCLRVYLNGDGHGTGTYLSLFISLMKGEYDSLLAWPFQQEVRFFILDQSQSSSKRHIADRFIPDPSLSSFQRPTSEMNIASGRPMFVSHSDLENPSKNFIVDDTLFIRCIVSSIGFSH